MYKIYRQWVNLGVLKDNKLEDLSATVYIEFDVLNTILQDILFFSVHNACEEDVNLLQ
jgi:hypothetical protein